MIPKERRHERILTLIVISGILFSAVCLFFLDGGQIWGINDDPDNRPSLLGKNIDGLNFTSAAGEIEPIYDDTEIVRIQFWQLSPREMLLRVITYPMAYIPLSTGKILSLLYIVSGLAFLMLYRRETGRHDPDPNSRRELINRYIREHPGKNTQQIADALGISRSSLTYYLHQLEAAGSIPSFQGKRSSVLSDTPVSSRMYQAGALRRTRYLRNDGCLVHPETQTIPDAHHNKTESKQSVQPDARSGDRISGTCQDLSAADG